MQNPSRPQLRPDFGRRQRSLGDDRAADRVIAHYLLERELSDRLRHASRESRSRMYAKVYRELFSSLPDHPQLRSRCETPGVDAQWGRIADLLRPDCVFLEIGCGNGALAFAAAAKVHTAYGLDVTDALIDFAKAPSNFSFLLSAAVEIPLPTDEIDFAYSNQLMEHLHPDDAADQVAEVYRVLKPGGRYMCITPSRVTGPHDISCYFDYEATCLHLKEYDYGALRALFRHAGFHYFGCSITIRGREMAVPYPAIRAAECGLLLLNPRIRASLTRWGFAQALLGLTMVAIK